MAHLRFKHIDVDIAPGGNPDILKADLIRLSLEHACDVHATRNGLPFYDLVYTKLMQQGVPE